MLAVMKRNLRRWERRHNCHHERFLRKKTFRLGAYKRWKQHILRLAHCWMYSIHFPPTLVTNQTVNEKEIKFCNGYWRLYIGMYEIAIYEHISAKTPRFPLICMNILQDCLFFLLSFIAIVVIKINYKNLFPMWF